MGPAVRAETRKPVCSAPAPQIPKTYPARIIAQSAGVDKKNLEELLAADLVAVFLVRAPEVDVVSLGLRIAEEAKRLQVSA